MDYTLSGLLESFELHTQEFEKFNAERIEHYKKEFPGKDVPENLSNEFCLSRALLVMCKEIEKLKQKL